MNEPLADFVESDSLRPSNWTIVIHLIVGLFTSLMLTAFVAQIGRDTHIAWASLQVILCLAAICGGILLIGGSLRDSGTKQISLTSVLGITMIVAAYLSISQAAIRKISPQQFEAASFKIWFFAAVVFLFFGYILFRVLANFTLCLVWLAVDLQRWWKRT